jgi:hypothetical protein
LTLRCCCRRSAAPRMPALASNIRSVLHRFTLHAAIFPRRHSTRTNRMRALFAISHVLSPSRSHEARTLLQRTPPFVRHQVNAVFLGRHCIALISRIISHSAISSMKIFHQHNVGRRVIHLRVSQPLSVRRNTEPSPSNPRRFRECCNLPYFFGA